MKRGFNSILNGKDRTHNSNSISTNHSLIYNILLMGRPIQVPTHNIKHIPCPLCLCLELLSENTRAFLSEETMAQVSCLQTLSKSSPLMSAQKETLGSVIPGVSESGEKGITTGNRACRLRPPLLGGSCVKADKLDRKSTGLCVSTNLNLNHDSTITYVPQMSDFTCLGLSFHLLKK